MRTTLAARRLITATSVIEHPEITLEGAAIAEITSRERQDSSGVTHNFPQATITSGLFDIHMHGAVGHDVMEGETDALRTIGTFLAPRGVTEYLATTVTASMEFTLGALDRIARHKPVDGEAAI